MSIIRNLLTSILAIGLGLVIWLGLGCSDSSTGPQDSEFYPIELLTGDILLYEGPTDSLTFTGPAEVYWRWKSGELFMAGQGGSVRVRPLEQFPSEPMTPEMIAQARAHFTDVPFIEELLAGIPDPSDEEWATAYIAWLDTISAFHRQICITYRDDPRPRDVLEQCGGNRSEAARRLGISRSTLYRRLRVMRES